MKTYILIFDLGTYRLEYDNSSGFSVSQHDHYNDFKFHLVNEIFDYLKIENLTEEICLKIHNQYVVKAYLNEYATFLNNCLNNNKGKITPVFFNCFAINSDLCADDLLNLIIHSNTYPYIRAIVIPLESFASNLNKESIFNLEYLKQIVTK